MVLSFRIHGTPSSNLTHALIKDSEGTPISITKTDSDVLTIYATVYATFYCTVLW